MILILICTTVVVLGGLAYMVGLFDCPEFKYREKLLKSNQPLYFLVAPCQEPSYAKHIPRVCQGTIDAIHTLPDATKLLADGAALYDDKCQNLCVGLYFDDPWKSKTPRWAIGWAVGVKDFKQAQALAEQANKHKPASLTERMVAVRVGPTGGVAGRIKWRTPITPMVMPMLMWSRAFAAYEKGTYTSECGRSDTCGVDGTVACEIYVTTGVSPNDKGQYIDYIVLCGDTQNVWNDTFPIETK